MNYTKGSLKVHDIKEWLCVHETELDMGILGDAAKTKTYYGTYFTGPRRS